MLVGNGVGGQSLRVNSTFSCVNWVLVHQLLTVPYGEQAICHWVIFAMWRTFAMAVLQSGRATGVGYRGLLFADVEQSSSKRDHLSRYRELIDSAGT